MYVVRQSFNITVHQDFNINLLQELHQNHYT